MMQTAYSASKARIREQAFYVVFVLRFCRALHLKTFITLLTKPRIAHPVLRVVHTVGVIGVGVARRIDTTNGVTALLWGILAGDLIDRRRAYSAPGWRLHRLAAWLFSPKNFTNVFEPVLSDMQVEFCDALALKQPIKARWVQFRGYWTFWEHVVLQIPISIARVVMALWRAL